MGVVFLTLYTSNSGGRVSGTWRAGQGVLHWYGQGDMLTRFGDDGRAHLVVFEMGGQTDEI